MKNLLLIFILVFSACAKDAITSTQIPLASKVELSYDTILEYQEGVKIKITKIEDSRCPQTVTCVWAGLARVYITISDNNASKDLAIDFESKPIKTTLSLGGQQYEIEVSDVLPYPKDTKEINQKDYKVSITVKKV